MTTSVEQMAGTSDGGQFVLEPEGTLEVLEPEGTMEVLEPEGTLADLSTAARSSDPRNHVEDSAHSTSSCTDDLDEEIYYHISRMRLHRARQLTRKFHSHGYRTIQEIMDANSTQIASEMGLGSGDLAKLAQGLERYRDGSFDDFYSLPLEDVVTTVEPPTSADVASQAAPDASSAGVQHDSERPALVHAVAQTVHDVGDAVQHITEVQGPDAAHPPPEGNVPGGPLPAGGDLTKLEKLYHFLAWAGTSVVPVLSAIVRGTFGERNKDMMFIINLLFIKGLLTLHAPIPLLIADKVHGLHDSRASMKSIMKGCVASMASAVLACAITGGCFDESAQVTLSNRSEKKISELKEGDRILSYNKGVFRVKRVLRRFQGPEAALMWRVAFRLANGQEGTVIVTPGHPLWVSGKGWCVAPCWDDHGRTWSEAPQVQVGDKFVHHTGATAQVISMKLQEGFSNPFNLVVDGPGTFFVSGILVHTSMTKSGHVVCYTRRSTIVPK